MNKTILKYFALSILIAAVVGVLTFCNKPGPGEVLDEAKTVGREADSFPAADEDYFKEMDSAVPLSPAEVKGRNNWIVWTGGNDRLWNKLMRDTLGTFDLIKTISSNPNLKDYSRDNRWEWFGLVNEPCFEKATGPDPERFGLWLDKRSTDCPPDPFENEAKYPGVKIGARGEDLGGGKKLPVGSYYGYATGIVGLRLFPNPAFDAKAAENWDPEKYYSDKAYYENKNLVLPYRVGMSCGFCHVGPNPVKPPADPENPKWENLSSNVGAQYFWIDRIFDWKADSSSFVNQLFHTSKPGALDTSLISSDNINNPRTMNAVYGLKSRLDQAKRFGKEKLAEGGSANNKQFNDFVPADSPLAQYYVAPDTVFAPHVLKDGADSVGAIGALNRVYVNIGLFSEEWLLHFRPLIGGKKITPIEISVARKNSSYWNATEAQTFDVAAFFLKTTDAHLLKDAPGGEAELAQGAGLLTQGKKVFAETCARCHSSKLPDSAKELMPEGCNGKDYLTCWDKYWAATKTDEFKAKMVEIVNQEDFLKDNFLSTEFRVPVTLLQTNACSPSAANGIKGNIWDNFSAETYKELPAVGKVTVFNPQTGAPQEWVVPGGGRGYTRPASLISIWTQAPFLLGNSVGKFRWEGSVEARLDSFNDSIDKMLNPENREYDATAFGTKREPGMGAIDRTTETSYLRVPSGYLPEILQGTLGWGEWLAPSIFGGGGIEIGPIPKGTPISLLANLLIRPEDQDLKSRIDHDKKLLKLVIALKRDLKEINEKLKSNEMGKDAADAEAAKVFSGLVEQFMEVSACPDYVVNRGHYFGTSFFKEEPALSVDDKKALIAYLKTF